ncbi:S-layer homology domain-containing protein [Paenibacillaceae bacterium WGS1546]|uniref:S-layer homology domain-containing protein n=1 Tax=Cohnella sp. WGS1546 TaxID=3366810 RepID=UPI00372D7E7A
MKKTIGAVLALMIAVSLFLPPETGYAAEPLTLNLSAKQVQRGGDLTLTGTAAAEVKEVVVKIVSPNDTVFYLDVIAPVEGRYSLKAAIPNDETVAPNGVYTVIAGGGGASGRSTFTVVRASSGGPSNGGGGAGGEVDQEDETGIPPLAGDARGAVVEPQLDADGKYRIGRETMSRAVEQGESAVTIRMPAAAAESGAALEFPADSLRQLQDARQGLIIESGNVTVQFPADALQASAEPDVRVRIALHTAWTEEAGRIVEQSIRGNADYAATGIVLSAVLELVAGEQVIGVLPLDKPAQVTIRLTVEQERSLRKPLAGVYYADGERVEYVGGTVANGAYSFTASHFSYYTILEYDKRFEDLAGHWAEEAVSYLSARHIVRGVNDRHYEPNRSISRAEFATLLMRALERAGGAASADGSENGAPVPFHDVPANSYYADHVASASSLGIVQGYGGAFRPNERITREEAAVMLVRAAQYVTLDDTRVSAPRFDDAAQLASWAASSVNEAWTKGLIQGDGKRFNPKGQATRAEVAVMIKRLLAGSSL